MSQPKQFKVNLLYKEQRAIDTISYYFDRSKTDIDFLPGQYLRLTLPITPKDGLGASRYFTISSSPLEKDYFMITTKRGKSDFKNALFELDTNTQVSIFAPIGGYKMLNDAMSHVFLSGGIGITPFHSMITYAAAKKINEPILLIASFSKPSEMIFYNSLNNIKQQNKNINIVYTITQPMEMQQWTGETGRISENLLKKHIPDLTKPTFYVAGPTKMVDATEQLLLKIQIPENNIKIEHFTGYE